MKTKIIISIILLLSLLITIDYEFGRRAPMEIGIVVHKTFAPPGNYAGTKVDDTMHVLVVLQTDRQTGYYMPVPRDYFYDIEPGDRVPLAKRYGLFTGYEYQQEIIMGD